MASKRRGPQYMPVLASFIACNVHASKSCVLIALLHALLSTLLLVTHVTLHVYKCTFMPSVPYSNAALEPMFTVLQNHRCCYRAKNLMPCNMQVTCLQLCSADKCALVLCMHIHQAWCAHMYAPTWHTNPQISEILQMSHHHSRRSNSSSSSSSLP